MRPVNFLIAVVVLFLSCNDNENSTRLEDDEIRFSKEGTLSIHKADSTSIALDIEFAETDYETSTGLMYRKSMEDNQGMLFIFEQEQVRNFYMKNTEFPLDIIYVKKDQKIASIVENAEPFNEDGLSSEIPVQYVLEINGGLAESWNIQVGDSISWQKN